MPYFIDEGKTGLLLKEDNPQQLADLMKELLSVSSYKENVTKMHEYYIQEYSWDAVAKRMKAAMDRN